MNILLVTGRFPQRSETFIYRKAVALADHGHEVTVLCRQRGDWSLYPDPLPSSLRIEVLPPDLSRGDVSSVVASLSSLARASLMPAATTRLYRESKNARGFARHLPFIGRRADVVHFEFLGLSSMYPLAGEIVGAPTITSCRGQDVHLLAIRTDDHCDEMLRCLRESTALHCVSEELAGSVERLTGRHDGIWINRPAVNVQAIRPRRRVQSNARLKILISGRLAWVKGFDYLLTALARLRSKGINFQADILGDGELHSQLRFSIADLDLTSYVTLVGGVSSTEVIERLGTTDVFVLSSLEEGISNSVLEAMASGIPVVTTNAGGMTEVVTDGVEGFVVPIRRPDALADAIGRLAGDAKLRQTMGTAGRRRAESEFSLERQVATFEQIYRAVRESHA